ncbi:MAG: GNAT family N-acetyltransferase [Phycisphaeraceae bacterium]|nr:GNAT family N-acetyltransferase [Phycisphaeraceae bacterium]
MSLDSPNESQRGRAASIAIDRRDSANITTRRLAPSDSIVEMTKLLHRAYAKQVALGLQPLAGRQTAEVTEQRVFSGECYVAVDHAAGVQTRTGQKLVGTILFHEVEESQGPPWFGKPEVASFSQLAVDPDYQGCGIGRMLMDMVEKRARETGAKELALSMAEPDRELYDFYIRRGYRFIEHWKWPYTNYRSAILSKLLG